MRTFLQLISVLNLAYFKIYFFLLKDVATIKIS